jgi:hypothetical protein
MLRQSIPLCTVQHKFHRLHAQTRQRFNTCHMMEPFADSPSLEGRLRHCHRQNPIAYLCIIFPQPYCDGKGRVDQPMARAATARDRHTGVDWYCSTSLWHIEYSYVFILKFTHNKECFILVQAMRYTVDQIYGRGRTGIHMGHLW